MKFQGSIEVIVQPTSRAHACSTCLAFVRMVRFVIELSWAIVGRRCVVMPHELRLGPHPARFAHLLVLECESMCGQPAGTARALEVAKALCLLRLVAWTPLTFALKAERRVRRVVMRKPAVLCVVVLLQRFDAYK
eukprot:CAMPEP_0206050426 /NCGR_PEP_ID=MMETSP1466-20131121/29146_1 /ASSEMBLY_ACC=CAM_ASM_001126 /TAXON_ID=44452 /ORGANISM="Pavlova gyrans, Strain CCMP608" /LENGTH=134 /DNA_ID=CAMNT_0053425537 /DNA_START=285 /DNA_END=689 /DNA_ORIENTATION=-